MRRYSVVLFKAFKKRSYLTDPLEVEKRKRVTSRRTGPVHPDQVIDDLMNRWHYEWTSTKRRWGYKLIPNIGLRSGR